MTHHLWHAHPHVRSGSDLSLGERAADRMRNGFGSWAFIFVTLAFLAAWVLAVFGLGAPIDNRQLTILNLILSMFAAMQGAIILLAARRADAVTAELATAHYAETSSLDDLVKANTKLTEQVHLLLQQNTALTEQVAALVGGKAVPVTEPEFAPPAPDEPVPEPPPESATDAGLGGVDVTHEYFGPDERVVAAAAAGTWAAVSAYARSYLGPYPPGRRRENVNDFTIEYYGTASIAAAWCLIFVWHVLKHFGLATWKLAFVPWLYKIPGEHDGDAGIKVGAICAIAGFSHVGFFVADHGSEFDLLSGNSTSGSSTDAITVKRYSKSLISGYVNVSYTTKPAPPPQPVPAAAGNTWFMGVS